MSFDTSMTSDPAAWIKSAAAWASKAEWYDLNGPDSAAVVAASIAASRAQVAVGLHAIYGDTEQRERPDVLYADAGDVIYTEETGW